MQSPSDLSSHQKPRETSYKKLLPPVVDLTGSDGEDLPKTPSRTSRRVIGSWEWPTTTEAGCSNTDDVVFISSRSSATCSPSGKQSKQGDLNPSTHLRNEKASCPPPQDVLPYRLKQDAGEACIKRQYDMGHDRSLDNLPRKKARKKETVTPPPYRRPSLVPTKNTHEVMSEARKYLQAVHEKNFTRSP
ncbi:hypothetical protein M011DRAFT_458262 [Sporormia fimetaria CBS 119925]|uniref:Uncharacterized protein n=1 Tax=Sporormia fimetaria CBS 119925 TaxID=1340428 RepID=A0A6A6VDA3_9PLEO|nr:hypothetical protein M011DRAFT_458262 [Sporormia fimetaria CBS 119925]